MLPPRRAPFGRSVVQPPPGATTLTASPDPIASKRGLASLPAGEGKGREIRWWWLEAIRPGLAIFPTSGRMASSGLGATEARDCSRALGAGTGCVGWYAGVRLILFATEWSAARRKPMQAA